MLKAFVVAAVLTVALGAGPQQPQNCASPDRRMTAIQLARGIIAAETAGYWQLQRYLPLSELPVSQVPDGYQVQLLTDGATYTFSIKDTSDACQGAVFSDQDRIIYTGAPLR